MGTAGDCILNCSSGKRRSACCWSQEHERQHPLSKRVKNTLLYRRLGFAFKSFTSTAPNWEEYKLPTVERSVTATSTKPKSAVQEHRRVRGRSSGQHIHPAGVCTDDCSRTWTKDPAVGQASSRDNQIPSFGQAGRRWVRNRSEAQKRGRRSPGRKLCVLWRMEKQVGTGSPTVTKALFSSEFIAWKSHYEESQETHSFKISIEITN